MNGTENNFIDSRVIIILHSHDRVIEKYPSTKETRKLGKTKKYL